MAKVGILGQRLIITGSSKIQPGDLKGFGLDYYGSETHIPSRGVCLVYKVPADVKMAVVDIDGAIIDGAAVYIVDNSKFDSRTEIFTSGSSAIVSISRKCMVLGPGQAIYVTASYNSVSEVRCLVTGIEHV